MSNQTCKKALAHQSNLLTLVHNSVRRSSNNEILQEIYPKKQEPIKDNLTTEPTQLIAEEISQGTPQDVYLNSMNHPLSKQLQNLTTSVKHVSVEKLKQVLLENEMYKQRIKDLENKCKSLEGRYHEKVNNGTLKGIVDNLEMTLKQDECEIHREYKTLTQMVSNNTY